MPGKLDERIVLAGQGCIEEKERRGAKFASRANVVLWKSSREIIPLKQRIDWQYHQGAASCSLAQYSLLLSTSFSHHNPSV